MLYAKLACFCQQAAAGTILSSVLKVGHQSHPWLRPKVIKASW